MFMFVLFFERIFVVFQQSNFNSTLLQSAENKFIELISAFNSAEKINQKCFNSLIGLVCHFRYKFAIKRSI